MAAELRLPHEVTTACLCRWERIDDPDGRLRLAKVGPRCPIHNEPTDGENVDYRRRGACRCTWVPTGIGWTRRMVRVDPDCVYHGGSVRLGRR